MIIKTKFRHINIEESWPDNRRLAFFFFTWHIHLIGKTSMSFIDEFEFESLICHKLNNNQMAANSKQYYDVLQWIYKVIESCETKIQAVKTLKLIRLFHKRFPSVFGEKRYNDYSVLRDYCYYKISQLGEKSNPKESK